MWHWQTPAIPVAAAFLAMFFPAPAESATALENAFDIVTRTVAEPTWNARLRVVADPSVTPALAVHASPGQCDVAALKDSAYIRGTLAQLDPVDRTAYLEGLLAHELGHCADSHRVGIAGVKIAFQAVSPGSVRSQHSSQQALRDELLADIYMGLYLSENHPERADRLMRYHLTRRSLLSDIDPEHNSARFLRVENLDRRAGESILQASLRIRDAVTR